MQATTDAASTPFLTQKQAAQRLGICADTVSEGIKAGRIPTVTIGLRKLIPAQVVDRLLAGEPMQGAEHDDAATGGSRGIV